MRVAEILSELNLGKSVAESDDRLDSYFVDTHTFDVLYSGQRDIIAGDKGTGKTALYRILMERHHTIVRLRGTEIVTAFNPSGSPIFQQLLSIAPQTEGQYVAFWKTYFFALVGNWLLDEPTRAGRAGVKRVTYFLAKYGLKTIDTTPAGIFTKILNFFPKALTPKSIEADIGLGESGYPHVKPKIEFAPSSQVQPPDFFGIDYTEGFRLLEVALRESNLIIWIAIDRLDEAFLGYPGVELPALRALLRTYLDLQAVTNIKLKLFLRKDLFRKVTAGGFVNLTHINDQKIEIVWDYEDLKNLLIARVKDTPSVVEHLSLENLDNDQAFSRLFPDKISQGEKQSTTWNWIMSRLKDGNGVIAPRNLIDLIEKAREAQLRSETRTPREYENGMPLIEAEAVRKAHQSLSTTRVQDTLFAEAADLAPLIEKFRNKKAEHNSESLSVLLGVPPNEVAASIKPLIELGFLEEVGTSYKVPMLYRDGLDITQGKAFNSQDNAPSDSDED